MALPSPTADFPDMAAFIAATRERANSMVQSGWAQLERMSQERRAAEAAAAGPYGQIGQYGEATLSTSNRSGGNAGGGSPFSGSAGDVIAALQSVETGYLGSYEENYRTLGPARENGDRAVGPVQIMTSNISSWTQEATGRAWDPQEMIAGLRAGDENAIAAYNATVEHKIGGFLQNGYTPQDIAVEWHSGPGGLQRYRAGGGAPRDFANGLSTWGAEDSYLSRFNSGLESRVASQSGIGVGQVPSWIQYENEHAIRNQPLSPELVNAMSYLEPMGVQFRVFSGGQPEIGTSDRRTGTVRHDKGMSGDGYFYRGDEMLNWSDPADIPMLSQIVSQGRQEGITGWGAGPGYMQPDSVHAGFGPEAVWGADGSSANAPRWLSAAYYGT